MFITVMIHFYGFYLFLIIASDLREISDISSKHLKTTLIVGVGAFGNEAKLISGSPCIIVAKSNAAAGNSQISQRKFFVESLAGLHSMSSLMNVEVTKLHFKFRIELNMCRCQWLCQ